MRLVDHPPCSPLKPLKETIYCPGCERVVPFVNRECVDCNAALCDATWRIPESVIPRDGEKHPCGNCGEGAFFWWDRDGWDRAGVIVDDGRVDVDCSGVTEECPNCHAVLVAEPRDKHEQGGEL